MSSLRDKVAVVTGASRGIGKGIARRLALDEATVYATGRSEEDLDRVVELDDALKRLETMDARQSQILEHRYFGGLSLHETASALGISLATVKRELRSARAWLAIELRDDGSA